MVLSAPRSGSTWVSNWLTTEGSLCLHDPVLSHSPEDLDALPCDRMLGLSCTGLGLLPDFVNAHPARKVIIHRDFKEVNRSLLAIGLSPLPRSWEEALYKLDGKHVDFRDLFRSTTAAEIYQFLTGRPFDSARHSNLTRMHIDPEFGRVPITRDRTRDFRARVARALA